MKRKLIIGIILLGTAVVIYKVATRKKQGDSDKTGSLKIPKLKEPVPKRKQNKQ